MLLLRVRLVRVGVRVRVRVGVGIRVRVGVRVGVRVRVRVQLAQYRLERARLAAAHRKVEECGRLAVGRARLQQVRVRGRVRR